MHSWPDADFDGYAHLKKVVNVVSCCEYATLTSRHRLLTHQLLVNTFSRWMAKTTDSVACSETENNMLHVTFFCWRCVEESVFKGEDRIRSAHPKRSGYLICNREMAPRTDPKTGCGNKRWQMRHHIICNYQTATRGRSRRGDGSGGGSTEAVAGAGCCVEEVARKRIALPRGVRGWTAADDHRPGHGQR